MGKIFNPNTTLLTKVIALVSLVGVCGVVYCQFITKDYYSALLFGYLYVICRNIKEEEKKEKTKSEE